MASHAHPFLAAPLPASSQNLGDPIMRPGLSSTVCSIAVTFGFLTAVLPAPARADVEISLSTDGTSWFNNQGIYIPFVNFSYYGSLDFNHSGLGVSLPATDLNIPGSSGVAILGGKDLLIVNNGSGTATLDIMLSDTGFRTPLTTTGSIHMESRVSATVSGGAASNAMTFQSYLDPSNTINGQGGYTAGPQSVNITNDPRKGSSSSDVATNVPYGSAVISPYSITELFQITLAAGSWLTLSSQTTLTDPPAVAPEPSTLFLAGMGLLGFVGYGLRRHGGQAG